MSSQNIRIVVREIEHLAKDATIHLQIIHSDLGKSKLLYLTNESDVLQYLLLTVNNACTLARQQIEACAKKYEKLSTLVPPGQYYR